MITVYSFWVLRPEEHPKAPDYPAMLKILQRSCDRLGVKHLVLTDRATAKSDLWPNGVESLSWPELPGPLMQAATEAHARLLEMRPLGDVLFVGADSILLSNPEFHFPIEPDLCVTSRKPSTMLDAINNGSMLVRERAFGQAARLYRRVAERCGTVWRDDQKALVAELAPVPLKPGMYRRADMLVAFLPMKKFNDIPLWPGDVCKDAVLLHFKGRNGKRLMFAWAQRQRFA